ncbi:MAG: ABC transporter substrate-binding protein, partial [Pseudomonadota bacterium]|nr:ABC transporter substrate-binding protein [Pseudomonadota bacterium]
TTLSTKAGYLGEEVRDGFQLAIDQEDGKLGGVPVELIVEDDTRKPAKAKQIAERMLARDKVDLLTGIIFSNIALAVVPGVVNKGVTYVSPNAGPSKLAGEGCHPNYFNASWQNDTGAEVMGRLLNEKGVGSVYLLAPNYPAGKDILAGFKRFYEGEVVAETYTKLGQADYAAELTNIRDAKPDAVFFFLPGGMGINFLKQYHQFGMKESIPIYGPMFSFDERLLQAVGDAAEGVENAGQWVQDLDNPANSQFVAAYREKYGRTPTFYASQGYDAARLIASALKVTGGVEDLDAFRAAMEKADFDAVRGPFAFGPNHHPVQDYYLREVVKGPDGKFTNVYVRTIVTGYGDSYAAECKM